MAGVVCGIGIEVFRIVMRKREKRQGRRRVEKEGERKGKWAGDWEHFSRLTYFNCIRRRGNNLEKKLNK